MNATQQVQYQTMLTKYSNMQDKLLPMGSTLLTGGMLATISHSEYERSNWPYDSSKTGPHHTPLASSSISLEWNAVLTFEVKQLLALATVELEATKGAAINLARKKNYVVHKYRTQHMVMESGSQDILEEDRFKFQRTQG